MKSCAIFIACLVSIGCSIAFAKDKPAKKPPLDFRKMVIENPLKKVVSDSTKQLEERLRQLHQPVKDVEITPKFAPKGSIELPLKKVVANKTNAGPLATPQPKKGFINPKVKPGDIRWHDSFDGACKASQESGKPVLLFQLLGRLDERFT